jgi:hypothetical protein
VLLGFKWIVKPHDIFMGALFQNLHFLHYLEFVIGVTDQKLVLYALNGD